MKSRTFTCIGINLTPWAGDAKFGSPRDPKKVLQAVRLTLSFIKFESAASQFSGVAFGKKYFGGGCFSAIP